MSASRPDFASIRTVAYHWLSGWDRKLNEPCESYQQYRRIEKRAIRAAGRVSRANDGYIASRQP